jgi:glycine oxidase
MPESMHSRHGEPVQADVRSGVHVGIVGAGVVGLACAVELLGRGATVTLHERGALAGAQACSWFAGGMLAPWCEGESAEEPVIRLGQEAAGWWERHVEGVIRKGTLVLAPSRDRSELRRFAQRTSHVVEIDADGIAALEPDLAGRFAKGLFFEGEGHLDPRRALAGLAEKVQALGGRIHFGSEVAASDIAADYVLDCRGLSARDALPDLRGVKGEMLLLRSRDIALSRPVRLLHPRIPLYVVPRADGLFMVGATMIESDAAGPITARSTMELLNAAYSLHPAFGEAEIVEAGVGIRPAFADNIPRVIPPVGRDGAVTINGLYRHGFLLAPSLARQAADLILNRPTEAEPPHETDRQRRSA